MAKELFLEHVEHCDYCTELIIESGDTFHKMMHHFKDTLENEVDHYRTVLNESRLVSKTIIAFIPKKVKTK